MPQSLPDYAYKDPMSAGWVHDQMDYDQQNGICNDALVREHEKPEKGEQDRTDNSSTSTTQRLLERLNVKMYLERVVLPLKQAWASRNLQPGKKPKSTKLEEDWVMLGGDDAKGSAPPRFLDIVQIPSPTLLHDMELDMEMGRVIPMRRKQYDL